jgi:SNF2 family DNA or RNA helicase
MKLQLTFEGDVPRAEKCFADIRQNEIVQLALKRLLPLFPTYDRTGGLKRLELEIPDTLRLPDLRALSSADALSGQVFSLEELLSVYFCTDDTPELYKFQESGVAWLLDQQRAILADDMGLGKSVQAIRAFLNLVKSGSEFFGVVVCPKSLVLNWLSEFRRWAPCLTVTSLIASSAGGREIWARQRQRAHIVVTTYEQLRLYHHEMEQQAQVLILDEAHRVKNLGSGRAKALRQLEPSRIWMLTGTPIERDADDLRSLMTILKPTQFTTGRQGQDASVLRAYAAPYILRRKKSDVLSELPPMIDNVEHIALSPDQRRSYNELIRHKPLNYLERFGKLRKLCDIDEDSGSSSKLDRIEEILEEIHENHEKAVVFSYWMAPLRTLAERLKGRGKVRHVVVDATLDILGRNTAITLFRESADCLLISGHIGSEGLTLTEANHVIFINRWWNPSALNQAKDRIRRIGQSKTTFSYSFVAPATIEEDISRLIARKIMTTEQIVENLRESIYQPSLGSLT